MLYNYDKLMQMHNKDLKTGFLDTVQLGSIKNCVRLISIREGIET